jgi:hypothetical protein
MIGYCGLDCEQCGAFIATQNNDDALRVKVAEEWARLYNAPIKPEHINCTGCQSAGVKTYYCDQLCEIRKCATKKSVSTCAGCSDYPCSVLDQILRMAPQAKATLDALRMKENAGPAH